MKFGKGNKFALGNPPNRGSFKPGHRPWNKNKKGIHLSPKSEFKKGRISQKSVPIGTIKQRKTKNGKIRNFIKITNSNWRELSWYRWRSGFGYIGGDIIHHLNGNILDDRIQNLIAMPRADHPKFHSRWGLKKIPNDILKFYLDRYGFPFINYNVTS